MLETKEDRFVITDYCRLASEGKNKSNELQLVFYYNLANLN